MIEAIVAIEDTAFFEHFGINIDAIFRAIIKDIKARAFVEGASTLTQQLVKNIALSSKKKLERKLHEVLLAINIEQHLSKEEILERYINEIFLGHGYYGFQTASQGYFNKPLKALSLKEIAILASLPRAPTYYDPTKHFDAVLSRANMVISRMHKLGWIDKAQFDASLSEIPKVYDNTLTQNIAPYAVSEAINQLSQNYPDLKSGGYNVVLSIDMKVQSIAKEVLKEGYEHILKRDGNESKLVAQLNGAFVALESKSGNVLALVGGIDYAQSQYNRATNAKRQIGSAIKPFIYQLALNRGYSPASMLSDISKTYEYRVGGTLKKWQPKNYSKDIKGSIALRESLIRSRNLSTISLVDELGITSVHEWLTELGFEDVPKDLSVSLGSFGLSVLDIASKYTLFSNYGKVVAPRLVLSIEDRDGVKEEFVPIESVYQNEAQAFLMVDILKDVVRLGTGRRAHVKGIEIAGKTGTTNDYIDSWFCGFSPDIQAVAWYGRDDNKDMKKTNTGGGNSAPVVSAFFTKILETYPQTRRHFKRPKGVNAVYIDGKMEYSTDISKAPEKSMSDEVFEEEELIF
jgi:penicillin-binding protein 1A